jgi:putative ABC transport system permease protein
MKRPRGSRWSDPLYRLLLRAYPAEFRQRFASDMAEDFAAMLRDLGGWRAWRRAAVDLVQSVPRAHAQARRRQVARSALSHRKEGAMSSLVFDLRHAIRMLLRAPVFTVVTMMILALGIGANSATFSLVNAALLRPLEFRDPNRLVLVYEGIPLADLPKMTFSPPDFVDFSQYQRSFSQVAAYDCDTMELSGHGEPRRLDITRASAELFPLLGVEPIAGRTFSTSEDRPGHDVAVLSYGLWQRIFAGRLDAIGSTVRLDRRPFQVIGVMPATFEFPKRGPVSNGTPAEAWVPRAFSDTEKATRGVAFNNSVAARLAPGVPLEQAQTELSLLAPRISDNYPVEITSSGLRLALSAAPLSDEIAGQARTPLLLLFAAVGLVLLIVCANVANLILSRAAVRRREIGIRVALGASRRRLVQLQLCESILLSSVGGALGLAIAVSVVAALPAVIVTSLPGLSTVQLDWRVVTFTLGLSLLTAVAFGVAPVWATNGDVASRLHEGGTRTAGGGRSQRIQQSLVTVTVTLAVVLLVGAGLLTRSFASLVATEPGFRPQQVLTVSVALPREAYPRGESVTSFIASALERLRALPGVVSASVSTDIPLESNESRAATPEHLTTSGSLPTVVVTWFQGEYFRTLGVPLQRGRLFTSEEQEQHREVAIVSASLAKRFWPGQDAIGKRLKWGGAASRAPWKTVVGVVGDVKDGPLREEPRAHVYVPVRNLVAEIDDAPPASAWGRTWRFALQSGGNPTMLVPASRAALASLDSALPVTGIATMERQLADSLAPQRFSTVVLAAFASGALLLAAIGLYGVLAFAVAQRTREIGVRIALGASASRVTGMVVREGMRLVIVGLALGLIAATALTRAMTSLLYRTDPYDLWTFLLSPLVLCAVGAIACYVPARRAARIEPLTALRTE